MAKLSNLCFLYKMAKKLSNISKKLTLASINVNIKLCITST